MSRTCGLIISLIILLVAICGGMAVGMVVQEAHAQDWPLDFALPQTAPQQDDTLGCCVCVTCQLDVLPPTRPTPDFFDTSCMTGTVGGVDKRACCYAVTATYQIQNECSAYCTEHGYSGCGIFDGRYTPYARRCIRFSETRIFPLILKWRSD